MITLSEMFVQGISTRRVKVITDQLCGVEISAMQVILATAQLDEILQEWRERPLGEIAYLYVDARYEKVREVGQVRDAAVLVASDIAPEGERQALGISCIILSECETHWKVLLQGLKGSWNKWCKVGDQRRSWRFGGSQESGLRQCTLAKMAVSPSAERRGLCT